MSYLLSIFQSVIKRNEFFIISTYFDGEFLANCDVERAWEEMHVLAYVYHWDRNSLWNLQIKERRKWVDIVLKQKQAESDAYNNE